MHAPTASPGFTNVNDDNGTDLSEDGVDFLAPSWEVGVQAQYGVLWM
jgi:hypothetical protein